MTSANKNKICSWYLMFIFNQVLSKYNVYESCSFSRNFVTCSFIAYHFQSTVSSVCLVYTELNKLSLIRELSLHNSPV